MNNFHKKVLLEITNKYHILLRFIKQCIAFKNHLELLKILTIITIFEKGDRIKKSKWF